MKKLLAKVLCVSLTVGSLFCGSFNSVNAAGKVTFASFDISYSNLYDTDTKSEYIDSKNPTAVVAGGKASLDLADKYGTKETGYKFTSGKALLYATLNGTGRRKLEWSGSQDKFKDGNAEVFAPVMTAGNNNKWDVNNLPYFEIILDTTGYEDISFSASIGATKKGPKSYRLAYRVGSTGGYTDIRDSGSSVTLSNNKVYTKISGTLPQAAKNQKQVSIKIYATTSTTVAGETLSVNPTGGKIGINHILIQGSKVSATQTKPDKTDNTGKTDKTDKSSPQSTAKASQTKAPSSQTGNNETVVKPGRAVISKAKFNAGKKKFTVTLKKNSKAVGFQIKAGKDKKITKGVKTVTVKGRKAVVKWKAGKGYVKARAYTVKADGSKVYGKWSSIKKIK